MSLNKYIETVSASLMCGELRGYIPTCGGSFIEIRKLDTDFDIAKEVIDLTHELKLVSSAVVDLDWDWDITVFNRLSSLSLSSAKAYLNTLIVEANAVIDRQRAATVSDEGYW